MLERDTTPLQNVKPPFPRLEYTDAVRILSAAQRAGATQVAIAAERGQPADPTPVAAHRVAAMRVLDTRLMRPFTLGAEPPVRLAMFTLDSGETLLTLAAHQDDGTGTDRHHHHQRERENDPDHKDRPYRGGGARRTPDRRRLPGRCRW